MLSRVIEALENEGDEDGAREVRALVEELALRDDLAADCHVTDAARVLLRREGKRLVVDADHTGLRLDTVDV